MKILHSADWHLGVKNLKLQPAQQQLVKDEMLMSVQNLFRRAYREDYDVVLICGDLFHSKKVSQKIISVFLKEVESFSRPVLYIEGNHDCNFNQFDNIPSNFIVLNQENYKFEYMDVDFYCETEREYLLDENKTNILLLHGHIENSSDNDFVDINKFLYKNFDYIALGHIHQSKKYQKANTIIAYSGSLFSCGFDECGDKGFLEVDIENKKIEKLVFNPFATRRYMICDCDITDLGDNYQIINAIESFFESNGVTKKDYIRVILNGFFKEDSDKSVEIIKNHLEEYFYVEIIDNSRLRLDIEKIKKEKFSFKYEFIALVENSDLPIEDKQKIIEIGLEALKGEGLNI